METDCVLGLDCGTQSVKAGLWTVEGRPVAVGSSALAVSSPRPGWAEQESRQWWDASRAAIRACCARAIGCRIVALGVAWQRETFTLTDGAGRPLRPALLWLDIRAHREVGELADDAAALHALTGKPMDITLSLPRLLWLRRHEPELFAARPRWTDVGCELLGRLTGRSATCLAGADTAGMIDLARRDWSDDVLSRAGLSRGQVPDLVEPASVVGGLAPGAAAETGLPAGIPVVAAGGDGQVFSAAALGVAPDAGISLTLGTSVVAGIPARASSISPLYRTLFSALPGRGFLLEVVIQSGTYQIRWLERVLTADVGGGASALDAEAAALPAGADGLVTVPHWWGTRFPEASPHSRGVTLGWADHHGRAHLYRSMLEGVAFELRHCLLPIFERVASGASRRVTVGGGGAKSRLWRTIIRDVLGFGLRKADDEAVAMGAAMLAAVGSGRAESGEAAAQRFLRLGEWEAPDPDRSAGYDRLYSEVYVPLREAGVRLSAALTRFAGRGES